MLYFETTPQGFSGQLSVLQFLGAPFGGMVGGFLAELFFMEPFGIKTLWAENLGYYSIYVLVGFLFGYAMQTAIPRSYKSGGRWVWIIPICFVAWVIWDD